MELGLRRPVAILPSAGGSDGQESGSGATFQQGDDTAVLTNWQKEIQNMFSVCWVID